MAKKTTAEKISESLANLETVSTERQNIESVLALTDNETVQNFIKAQKTRYDSDVSYLRAKIVRLAAKASETMTVDDFATFAKGLSKLVS